MAKIQEELVVLKLSKLVRENSEEALLVSDELKQAIENLLTTLGSDMVIEVVDLSALGL